MTRSLFPRRAAFAALLALVAAVAVDAKPPFETYGRVGVRPADAEGDRRTWELSQAVEERYARAAAEGAGAVRLINFSRDTAASPNYQALVYDYTEETAFALEFNEAGDEVFRERLDFQPTPPLSEFLEAARIVAADARWKTAIADGSLETYRPMPPVTVVEGRRAVNVGIVRPDLVRAGEGPHEIVSVVIKDASIAAHEGGAPPSSRAALVGCGMINSAGCNGAGPGGAPVLYDVAWPAANPVWEFSVIRPSQSTPHSGANQNGSGLELREVRFHGRLVFVRAHAPILDVIYPGGQCGPYRDWFDSESCFQAVGTVVSPGIMVASAEPATFCESGSDNGSFNGVAIWDEGTSLWLATECDAGWYRYIMQWRFHLDGRIEPIAGFGATTDSCVCFLHHHHNYWRFDTAPDGDLVADVVTGESEVARGVNGAAWVTVPQETFTTRPVADPTSDWWRIMNPTTAFSIEFEPGDEDGSAFGDAFAVADNWALAYSATQLSDGRSCCGGPNQNININGWANGETLDSGRVVLWYRGGHEHDIAGGDTEPCHLVGPTIHVSFPMAADGWSMY